jgi:feruloyl esterase
MSTDAGHNSSIFDGAWEGLGPEVTIDFGWRAVHLSTVYAKEITTQFYGTNFTHAYYTGCSSGGKQGLKSIQRFPEDFDGALVGAPAYQWNYLNAYSIHVNLYETDNSSAGWISPAQIEFLATQVTKACDALDGVVDGVIANPRVCTFRPETMLCQYFPPNTTECFTPAQVVNLENIYRDYVETNSTYIFPAFEKGSESFWPVFGVTGTLTPLQPDYYALQVLNVSVSDFDPYSLNLTVINLAQQINPGDIIADNPDLSPYFARNGKVIHYHGWADPLIASRTSIDYYNQVERTLMTDFSGNYRLFMVPGMSHCAGGPGPWIFNSDPEGAVLDQTAGLVDQLIAWVETNQAPDTILGTKYVNDTGPLGIEFQRPICPYPSGAVFTGTGNWTQPQNWVCQ